MPDWQPIIKGEEPAGEVLVWCPNRSCATIVMWNQCYWDDGDGDAFIEPTHWMPLPSAPSSKD